MKNRLIEILKVALKYHVSDIHLTVIEKALKIEMRINGKILPVTKHQEDIRFFRYLMYRSDLDLSNQSEPQTGHFEELIDNKTINLRFACLYSNETINGVLRILNTSNDLSIEDLANEKEIIESFKKIQDITTGLIVFSGPTSSGKTTTLYTILRQIKDKKIFTLEDPIEILDDHFLQIQINERNNFGYAQGIKQLMRHDPDIVMIGEIRDEEAAKMAIRCALTGHLVVTSIHASDCIGAIERLLELGVAKLQLHDVLKGIYNQRLISLENHKIGIYEYLNEQGIDYYFSHNSYDDKHKTIDQKLSEIKDFI